MCQMLLKVSAKKLDPKVNYINLNKEISLDGKPDFLFPSLKEEVKKARKKDLKKYAKIARITLTTSVLLLGLVHPTFAATTIAVNALPGAGTDVLMPKDIVHIGLWIIGIAAATSSVLAIILMQLAGGYRMLRKENKKDATEWTTEIMKGYTQIILAPVIILAIAFIAYLFFGNFQWFAKPF